MKLRMWDLGQCDATRCSGRKLCKVGVMREIKAGTVFGGILLSPYGKKSVSPDVRRVYIYIYRERERERRSRVAMLGVFSIFAWDGVSRTNKLTP